MKIFKLLLALMFMFSVVACGDDEEATDNSNTDSEETVGTSERDAYIEDAASRGVEAVAAGCMYDMLFEDIGSDFYEQFNDLDYDFTEEDQAAALKAAQECGVLEEEEEGLGEELPEVRETAIQELVVTLGITEEDATCLVDGVVEEYGSNILGTDRTPTPEDQQRIIEIAAVCEIDLGGNNATSTTLPSAEN